MATGFRRIILFFDENEWMNKSKVTKHSNFQWNIHTEIIIDASKEKVWSILMDFDTMPQWSKTLQKIKGDLSTGSRTKVNYIFKEKLREINHTMVDFEEGTQFGWSDTLIPFAKDHHIYRVEALPDGKSKFIQEDEVKGLTAALVVNMLMNEMIETYPAFNEALKQMAEKK